jgi:hypothetical protein
VALAAVSLSVAVAVVAAVSLSLALPGPALVEAVSVALSLPLVEAVVAVVVGSVTVRVALVSLALWPESPLQASAALVSRLKRARVDRWGLVVIVRECRRLGRVWQRSARGLTSMRRAGGGCWYLRA